MPPKKRVTKTASSEEDVSSPQNKRARKEVEKATAKTTKAVKAEDLNDGGNATKKIIPSRLLPGFHLPWYKEGKKNESSDDDEEEEENDMFDDDEEDDDEFFDDDEDEDDFFDNDCDEEDVYNTERRCKGVKWNGERCKVTSAHTYDCADPLIMGGHYCTYHEDQEFERRRRVPAAPAPGRAFAYPDFNGYRAGAAGTTSVLQRMLPQAGGALLADRLRVRNPDAEEDDEEEVDDEAGDDEELCSKNAKSIETKFRLGCKTTGKTKVKAFEVAEDVTTADILPARMEWKVQKNCCESRKALSEITATLFVHDLSATSSTTKKKTSSSKLTKKAGTISAYFVHTKALGRARRTVADILDEYSQESYEVGEFIEDLYKLAATGQNQNAKTINDVGNMPTILSGDTLYIKEVVISDSDYEGHGLGLLMLDQMKKFVANEFNASSADDNPREGFTNLLTLLCVNIMWNDDDGLVGSIAARKKADKDLAIDEDSQTAAWRASVEGKSAPKKKKLTKKEEQALTSVYDTRRKAFLNYYNLLGMRFLGKKSNPYLASYGGNPDGTIEEVCPHLTGGKI